MKPALNALRAAFSARSRRERAVLLTAAIVLTMALGYQFGVEPALMQQRLLNQRLEQQRTDLQVLAPQWLALEQRSADPDAGRKAQIEVLRNRLEQLDEEFLQLQHSMVPPREMGGLIEGLLKQHGGLQLMGLRSLPVLPLSQRETANTVLGFASAASAPQAAASAASGSAADKDVPDAWLYLHGVQITVQGNYADMQAYLDAMEHLPRRLFWGPLKIDAQAWPASVMTITIYTVSLERTWWSV